MFFKRKEKIEASDNSAELFYKASKKYLPWIEFTPDGVITGISDQSQAMFEYQADELIGMMHSTLFREWSASSECPKLWRTLSTGEIIKGVNGRRTKSGKYLFIDEHYFPVHDQNGQIKKIILIGYDVTAEQFASMKKNALIDSMFKSQSVIELSPSGHILSANDNFLSMFGYSVDLIGKPHSTLCFDKFYSDSPNFWQDVTNGILESGLFERKKANGDKVWIISKFNAIVDDKGNLIKVIKIANEVTGHIERNHAISQASEVAYTTAIETAQIAQEGAALLSTSVSHSLEAAQKANEMVQQVEEINASSKNIQNIVSTIKSVADQTNLLALNAAIEAARAGEQGRGFSVVADEVRQLAARTTGATTNITDVVEENLSLLNDMSRLITEMFTLSEAGSNKISEVSLVMDEIHKGAENVSSTVMSLSQTQA